VRAASAGLLRVRLTTCVDARLGAAYKATPPTEDVYNYLNNGPTLP
jgi:hypothetical protein